MKHHSDGSQAAAIDHGKAGVVGAEAITTTVPKLMLCCALHVMPVEPFALFQWFIGRLTPAD
jgi:hypothetical protein